MIEINWNAFRVKFDKKENWAFEQLSYQLFCQEFGIRNGIFRFKNQTGIETNPVNFNDHVIGFQSKFLTNSISQNRQILIDSIEKTKKRYPSVNKLLFYLNVEFSESSDSTQSSPKYKSEIENEALKSGIIVEWRVPSHFERQLALPENKFIAEDFFVLGKSISDFINEIGNHSKNILFAIHDEIIFNESKISIDRSNLLTEIKSELSPENITIIAGEGGSGKTALIKHLYMEQADDVPFYVFKAGEFSVQTIDLFFNKFGNYRLVDFIESHKGIANKVIIIDSAERLADLETQDPFIEFLSSLLSDSWTIVLTTRHTYLEDIKFHFLEVYKRKFKIVNVDTLNEDELIELSNAYSFLIPGDRRLRKLLRNPFYLNEYLTHSTEGTSIIDISSFRTILWQKKILHSSERKGNIHIKRESCFLEIVKRRCETGLFYIGQIEGQDEALSALARDEIIQYDIKQAAYFITHDIYEEWALDLIISREFDSASNFTVFFNRIGTSLAMRRAFRNWLSEKLVDSQVEVRSFIESVFLQPEIEKFWQDELLISVLFSEYSVLFIKQFEKELLSDDFVILKRLFFLLKLACREMTVNIDVSNSDLDLITELALAKPKGKGWEAVFNLIHSNVDIFRPDMVETIVSLLYEWASHYPFGHTTALTGEIAFDFYTKSISNEDYKYIEEKQLIRCLMAASSTLKTQLSQLIDEIISDPTFEIASNHYAFIEAVLTSTHFNVPIIAALPEKVAHLAEFFWWRPAERDPYMFSHGMEGHYGINTSMHHSYFPASAYQTPVLWLLRVSPQETLSFIIRFTNKVVEKYSMSEYGKDVEKISVRIDEDVIVEHFASNALWTMYRGTGSPVTPYLLQSIHMALEKYLLQFAEQQDSLIVSSWLKVILANSKSASLAAVVASVVLAHPDKFFDIALIFFRCHRYYFYDNLRLSEESSALRLYSIGRGLDIRTKVFEDERIATCNQEHRNLCIEHLALQYQFFKNERISDEEVEIRQNEIWKVIDEFYCEIKDSPDESKINSLRFLVSRIDRRKMNPKVDRSDGNKVIIDFNPSVEDDLKRQQEEVEKQFETQTKYSSLLSWGMNKFDKQRGSNNYKYYDDDTKRVISEVRDVLNLLESGSYTQTYFRLYSLPSFCCAALVREFAPNLDDEDRAFCMEVLISSVYRLFEPNYEYQISDGVEAAIHAIPSMYAMYPSAHAAFNGILLLTLFDSTPIGNYKMISEYALEAINLSLSEKSPENVRIIFNAFVKYKVLFDQKIKIAKQGFPYLERRKRIEVLEAFIAENNTEWQSALSDENWIADYNQQLTLDNLSVAIRIIPNNVQDSQYNNFILASIPRIKSLLKKDKNHETYTLKYRIFNKYALIILHKNGNELQSFIDPLTKDLQCNESVSQFFEAFIVAEDLLAEYDSFWEVWNSLIEPIKELIKRYPNNHYLEGIICSFLLASNYWNLNDGSWHALRQTEKQFFVKIVNIQDSHPEVLRSIAKFLCQIGQSYLDDGIYWIGQLLSNESIKNGKYTDNTIFYLETIVRKYAYLNRSSLRKSVRSKNNFVAILDFLVEKGSVLAYVLREEFI